MLLIGVIVGAETIFELVAASLFTLVAIVRASVRHPSPNDGRIILLSIIAAVAFLVSALS